MNSLLTNLDQFPADKQERMLDLLDKNREGTITPPEKAEVTQLVDEAEQLMVANAQRLAAGNKKGA